MCKTKIFGVLFIRDFIQEGWYLNTTPRPGPPAHCLHLKRSGIYDTLTLRDPPRPRKGFFQKVSVCRTKLRVTKPGETTDTCSNTGWITKELDPDSFKIHQKTNKTKISDIVKSSSLKNTRKNIRKVCDRWVGGNPHPSHQESGYSWYLPLRDVSNRHCS